MINPQVLLLLILSTILACSGTPKNERATTQPTVDQEEQRQAAVDEAILQRNKQRVRDFNGRLNHLQEKAVVNSFTKALIKAGQINPKKGSYCLDSNGTVHPADNWKREGDTLCGYEPNGDIMLHFSYGIDIDGNFNSEAMLEDLAYQ